MIKLFQHVEGLVKYFHHSVRPILSPLLLKIVISTGRIFSRDAKVCPCTASLTLSYLLNKKSSRFQDVIIAKTVHLIFRKVETALLIKPYTDNYKVQGPFFKKPQSLICSVIFSITLLIFHNSYCCLQNMIINTDISSM